MSSMIFALKFHLLSHLLWPFRIGPSTREMNSDTHTHKFVKIWISLDERALLAASNVSLTPIWCQQNNICFLFFFCFGKWINDKSSCMNWRNRIKRTDFFVLFCIRCKSHVQCSCVVSFVMFWILFFFFAFCFDSKYLFRASELNSGGSLALSICLRSSLSSVKWITETENLQFSAEQEEMRKRDGDGVPSNAHTRDAIFSSAHTLFKFMDDIREAHIRYPDCYHFYY